jgi:hypothetical protein
MARQTIADRGGTERLKEDAARLRGIATGPGTGTEKARQAGDALKQPSSGPRDTPSERDQPDPRGDRG